MCPCLVDIEIVDTRNGNESNLVTAGQEACACDDPGRKVGVKREGGLVWGGWRRRLAGCLPACLPTCVPACAAEGVAGQLSGPHASVPISDPPAPSPLPSPLLACRSAPTRPTSPSATSGRCRPARRGSSCPCGASPLRGT